MTQPITITEDDLLALADSMASAASHFTSHGYDEFILARAAFIAANRALFAEQMLPLRSLS